MLQVVQSQLINGEQSTVPADIWTHKLSVSRPNWPRTTPLYLSSGPLHIFLRKKGPE